MATVNADSYLRKNVKNAVGDTSRAFAHQLDADLSVADELNFFALPKDVKFLDGLLSGDRLDTDGAPTLDVDVILSDGTTTLTLVSGFTGLASATAANRIARFALPDAHAFVTDSSNFRLYVLWNAVAATFAAGKLRMVCSYTVQDIHGGA